MIVSREAVIEHIRKAFEGITLGSGVGLFQGQALDDHESDAVQADARAKDEKQDWTTIPTEHLNRCYSSLSFFDAEGMRFHLPAFIVADLSGHINTINPVYQLTSLDNYGRSRFTMFSAEQRAAGCNYLIFGRDDPDQWPERGRRLDRAIDSYWNA